MAIEMAEADLDGRGLHPSGCTDVGTILSRILLLNVPADSASCKNQTFIAETFVSKPVEARRGSMRWERKQEQDTGRLASRVCLQRYVLMSLDRGLE